MERYADAQARYYPFSLLQLLSFDLPYIGSVGAWATRLRCRTFTSSSHSHPTPRRRQLGWLWDLQLMD